MQIKLKKYFMIFLGATLVSTSGKRERERNTLTNQENCQRTRTRRTHCCVRKSLNILHYYQCATKVAHLFLADYPPFVCHARPILHIYREPYHEERT